VSLAYAHLIAEYAGVDELSERLCLLPGEQQSLGKENEADDSEGRLGDDRLNRRSL